MNVRAYIQRLRAGSPADPDYEREALTPDLGLDTLDLVEMLLVLGRDKDMDAEAIAGAMRSRGNQDPGCRGLRRRSRRKKQPGEPSGAHRHSR